jgi:DNA processing protein
MNSKEVLLLLNMVKGIGPREIKGLLSYFGNVSKIFKDKQGLDRILGRDLAVKVLRLRDDLYFKQELRFIEKQDIQVITLLDREYPGLLKEIYSPPLVLYIKGDSNILKGSCLGIVGSRKASVEGLKNAREFAYKLSSLGFTIVSGLARGIDTAAHKGCLEARGRTAAVLGSGLFRIYPAENRDLFESIVQKGCVVSEFPLRAGPLRENFPRRNRIISGLSLGTLIVEAALKSGALITANFALEQGREVFALPGKVGFELGKGANSLIKQGAVLAEEVQDILEGLNVNL